MSEEFVDKKQFVNLVKKIKGGVFAMNIDNALYGMKKPKMLMTLIQPAPETANEKYQVAKYYLGVPDIVKIMDTIMRVRPTTDQATPVFQGYQWSFNKKRNCIEARVLKISAKLINRQGQSIPYYSFSIENCVGEQTQVKNGAGQTVPGVVKPATGSKAATFAKNNYNASRDEAIYIATMMRLELQAWRTAINTEMLFYPNRYRVTPIGINAPEEESQPPTMNVGA